MPKKMKTRKMPADFYNMKAFNDRDKKITMKEVFGKNAPNQRSPKAKTNIKNKNTKKK